MDTIKIITLDGIKLREHIIFSMFIENSFILYVNGLKKIIHM